jgi:hypothetical protein
MKFTETLEEDINNQINAGFTRYEIKQNLLMKGISEQEINKTFETINFEQAAANRHNGVSYKSVIITIVFLLISTFKIVRCISDQNRNETNAFEQHIIDLPANNYHEQISTRFSEITGQRLMYKDYKELINSDIEIGKYKITKLAKDTSIYLDLKTKMTIKKGTLYYNNHSERLKMALKGDDNINISIYDFEGKENLLEEFKASKAIGKYEYLSSEKAKSLTTIQYNYVVDNILQKGCAYAFKEGKNYFYFVFESNYRTHNELKMAGLSFLTQRIVKI